MGKHVKVTQPTEPKDHVTVEVLATAIREISQGMRKLRAGPLTDRALHLLIHDAISPRNAISIRDIKVVLEVIGDLERIYLKPKKAA